MQLAGEIITQKISCCPEKATPQMISKKPGYLNSGIFLLIDQAGEFFLKLIQNEYMCDTTNPPAQADGFGDYVIIPDGVDSSTSKVDGCVLSNHPAKIPVPTISKYSLLSTLQEIHKTQNFSF